jgi:hypothetical protein
MWTKNSSFLRHAASGIARGLVVVPSICSARRSKSRKESKRVSAMAVFLSHSYSSWGSFWADYPG